MCVLHVCGCLCSNHQLTEVVFSTTFLLGMRYVAPSIITVEPLIKNTLLK